MTGKRTAVRSRETIDFTFSMYSSYLSGKLAIVIERRRAHKGCIHSMLVHGCIRTTLCLSDLSPLLPAAVGRQTASAVTASRSMAEDAEAG